MHFTPLSRSFSKKLTKPSDSSYTSCFDLPLYNFIQITLTNDLHWLVISGNPDNLAELWSEILGEYSDISETPEMVQAFKLKKKIKFLSNKIDFVNILLNRLSLGKNTGVIELLVEQGFTFTFDDLPTDIERSRKRLSNDTAKLRMALADYASLVKEDGDIATLQSWEDELFELSKYRGFAIDKHKTTVSEFVAIRKSFKAYVEYLKKSKKP